jgi:hypothetical protein
MINITCKCGHTADLIEFTRTLISGDLPPGHFQCPECGVAWKRVESDHRILRAGSEATIFAGKVSIVATDSRL